MLQSKAFVYGLFVITAVASSAAMWQTLEVLVRDKALAAMNSMAATSRRTLQVAAEKALAAEQRARITENDLKALQQSIPDEAAKLDAVRADLAAARQQLSVAETAVTEAEEQLSAEITAHAALKAKSAEMATALAKSASSLEALTPKAALAEPAPVTPAPVTSASDNQAKSSDSAPKRTVTIEPQTVKKAQTKPLAKRATKTAKEPEAKPFFPLF